MASSSTHNRLNPSEQDTDALSPREQARAADYNQKYDPFGAKNLSGSGMLWHWPTCSQYWNIDILPPYDKSTLEDQFTTKDLKLVCYEWFITISDVDDTDTDDTDFRTELINRIIASPQNQHCTDAYKLYLANLAEEQAKKKERKKNGKKKAPNRNKPKPRKKSLFHLPSSSRKNNKGERDGGDDTDDNSTEPGDNDGDKRRDNDRGDEHSNPSDSDDGSDRRDSRRRKSGDPDDDGDPSDNSDDDNGSDGEKRRHNRFMKALSGFSVWSRLDSLDIQITGDDDEDLLQKLADISFYKESTGKSSTIMYTWLTNTCLKGRAKLAFRTAYRADPDSLDTLSQVLNWLYMCFNGRDNIDAKKLAYKNISQQWSESPKQYFRRFDIAVQSYLDAAQYAMELYEENDAEHNITTPSATKIWTEFINSLQRSTQREVRTFYNQRDAEEDYDDRETLEAAVNFAEKQLYPDADIILRGNFERKLRDQKLTRIFSTMNDYQQEYDGRASKRRKLNEFDRFSGRGRGGFRGNKRGGFRSDYRGRRGRYSKKRGYSRRNSAYISRGGYRGHRNSYRGRGRDFNGYKRNYRGRGRGRGSRAPYGRNTDSLPTPKIKSERRCWSCNKLGHEKKDCPQSRNNSNSRVSRGNRRRNSVQVVEAEHDNQNDQNFTDLFPLTVIDGLETANIEPDLNCVVKLYITLSGRDKVITNNTAAINGDITPIPALLDCGASLSVVDSKFVDEHQLHVDNDSRAFNCRTANGKTILRQYVTLSLVDQDYPGDPKATYFTHKFYVLPNLPHSVLIGRPLMRTLRYRIIRLEREQVHHEARPQHLLDDRDDIYFDKLLSVPTEDTLKDVAALKAEVDFVEHHILAIQRLDTYPSPLDVDKIRTYSTQREFDILAVNTEETFATRPRCGHIKDTAVRSEFEQLLTEYDSVVAKHWADCGLIPGITLKLDLKEGTVPYKKAPYPTSYKMIDEWTKQRKLLEGAGFIVRSNSEFAHPFSWAAKKLIADKVQEWRMVIDYRELNKHTIRDHYPIPNINTLQRKFHGAVLFSQLDLRHGYHHIAIAPEDRHKTAFITPDGLYEWTRMGFGFVNAPATFQRAMDFIFKDVEGVVVYIDDILVCAATEQEMLERLTLCFQKLLEFNMKVRMDKCCFFMPELQYLGHIISAEGTRPDPKYVQKLVALQRPAKGDIQRYIGFVQWLGKFIPHLAQKLEPISRLRRKNVKYEWTEEQEKAYLAIQSAVQKAPILKHPDLSKTFFVVCDASGYAVGSVLLQKHDGVHCPVEFFSRLLDKCQRNWHVSEKEVVCIIWSCEKWEKFLLIRHFHVYTDHRNLVALLNYESDKVQRSKLTRWFLRLQQFDFTAHYITGMENIVADFLSRDVHSKEAKIIDDDQFLLQTTQGLRKMTVQRCGREDHHIFNLDAIIDRSVRLWEEKQRQKAKYAQNSLSRGVKQLTANSPAKQQEQRQNSSKVLSRRDKQYEDTPATNTTPTALSRGVKRSIDAESEEDLESDSESSSESNIQHSDDEIDTESNTTDFYEETTDILRSRSNWSHILDLNKVKEVQRIDPIFRPLIDALTTDNTRAIKLLPKYAQKQYRRHRFIVGTDGLLRLNNTKQQVLIPPRFRDDIMRYFHQSYGGLHQAARRIYKTMSEYVSWFGMLADVKQFVSHCKTCKLAKTNPVKHAGYLQTFTAKEPFDMVAIDLVGPLPTTRRGNRYILTGIDRFSRFVRLIPLQTITGENVAVEFRANWILKHGVPRQILSDRGSQFTGYIFRILCNLFGIKKQFTTAYHPQTNGMIERFHRFLKERLRCIAFDNELDFMKGDDWDIFLPEIEFAYNNTKNEMTGTAPYEVIYGHILRTPSDTILKQNVQRVVEDTVDIINEKNTDSPLKLSKKVRDYVKSMEQHRNVLLEEIKSNMKRYDEQRKRYFDKKRSEPTKYEKGDKVVVDTTAAKVGNKAKLNINRKRAVIIDKQNDNCYVVRYNDGKKEAVNIKRIYRFTAPQQSNNNRTVTRRRVVTVIRSN